MALGLDLHFEKRADGDGYDMSWEVVEIDDAAPPPLSGLDLLKSLVGEDVVTEMTYTHLGGDLDEGT